MVVPIRWGLFCIMWEKRAMLECNRSSHGVDGEPFSWDVSMLVWLNACSRRRSEEPTTYPYHMIRGGANLE